MTKENNKGEPNGFNVYKNNSFLFVVSTDDYKEVKRHIIDYVKVNNFNLSDYSYKRFENHNSDNFEMVSMKITYQQIRSFTDQFQNKTCSDGWITDIVNGEVDIDKLKSFVLTHYEEHKDVDGNKVLDGDIEGYFTKDNCGEIFVKTEKKKERQDPVEDEPMCTHCHSSDVLVNDDEDGDISQGHCNECEEDRELTIYEGETIEILTREKGKVK